MLEAIIKSHLARYPVMEIQDVYKLIHQATMGSGHAVSNPEMTRLWLENEVGELDYPPDVPNEPMLDPISADKQILRVHLRPFISQGGNLQRLLAAFIRTANEYHGDQRLLRSEWDSASRLNIFPVSAMEDFIQDLSGYPAVSHSKSYVQHYHPAYRVVIGEYL